jgi:hypothetical protein
VTFNGYTQAYLSAGRTGRASRSATFEEFGMRETLWKARWPLILLCVTILCCVSALLGERAERAALRQSSIDSQEVAEIHRRYYQGECDDVSPTD